MVSYGRRRRVWRLTCEDGEVLVLVLPEMLDCSNEPEWCNHGGFGSGTSGEEGGTTEVR